MVLNQYQTGLRTPAVLCIFTLPTALSIAMPTTLCACLFPSPHSKWGPTLEAWKHSPVWTPDGGLITCEKNRKFSEVLQSLLLFLVLSRVPGSAIVFPVCLNTKHYTKRLLSSPCSSVSVWLTGRIFHRKLWQVNGDASPYSSCW